MKSPHDLVESLAEEMGEEVLKHSTVQTVTIDIAKPDVWNDCTPGVCITRSR
jgi:dihydroneopterin aldolase